MQPVWVVAGTRPEVVKLAPVYRALHASARAPVRWVATGQHTDLAEQALADFGITPNLRLAVPRPETVAASSGEPAPHTTVAEMLANLIRALDQALAHHRPQLIVVQGDTTSTLAAAIAGFSRHIPIAHVEAGLRSFDLMHPFPEEAWRSMVSQVARFHFAPTDLAARNLKAAGVAGEVHVTGNTVVDALHWLIAQDGPDTPNAARAPLVTVTLHRRENWDEAFGKVCGALVRLADKHREIGICFVAHANPVLHEAATRALGGHARVRVVPPMGYRAFVRLLRSSKLVLSDSGGVQEEAPALGVPVLVLREKTERPEAIEAGVAKLVGTDPARIVAEASHLLSDEEAYRRMARCVSPFGDGKASTRIADAVAAFLARDARSQRSVA